MKNKFILAFSTILPIEMHINTIFLDKRQKCVEINKLKKITEVYWLAEINGMDLLNGEQRFESFLPEYNYFKISGIIQSLDNFKKYYKETWRSIQFNYIDRL